VSRDNPFAALGLAARPDLSDDDVRAAWRRVAAATHPDRADGGDPDRFAGAAAAYTTLRTRSGRGEALADLAAATGPSGAVPSGSGRSRAGPSRGGPSRGAPSRAAPSRAAPSRAAPSRGGPLMGYRRWPGAGLLSRIRRGRVARLALRAAIAAAVSAGAAAVAGTQPATPAVIVGAVTWLLVTARNDLAPPG
jgi:curved DNA-binding protein CbpA